MFCEHFVKWLLQNYDNKMRQIKARSDAYKESRADEDNYQERLNMSANILLLAFELFLEFCEYKGWKQFVDYKSKFKVAVQNVLTNQLEALELDEQDNLDLVAEAYISIMNREDFDEGKGKPSLWEHDFYISKSEDTVYLPGRILTDAVYKQILKEYPCSVIANAFDTAGLLRIDKNRKGSRSKKVAGKRCYHIRLSAWHDYIAEKKMMEE